MTFDFLRYKLSHWLRLPWEHSHQFWVFRAFSYSSLGARTGQTDRQTDGRAGRVMRPRDVA